MAEASKRYVLAGISGLAALTLAGCGGGGSAPPRTAPPPPATPTPTPTPTPPPQPTPSPANDSEYQTSRAAVQANAIVAYDAGATGQGVKIAVVDTGINAASPEFAGRIDPASRDVVANRGVSDSDGHGTAVSAVAAAARNGSFMQGVAYQATILSLRTDEVGPCTGEDGCQFADRDIATAVDIARQNQARVINMSLGGSTPTPTLLAAINRATSAGIVVIISAGNDGATPEGANPDGFALDSARMAGNGLLIIAGATDAARQLAAFSNKAGDGAQFFLAALGDRVPAFDHTGQQFLFSGTSFAAPAIAGAAALLAQAFPNLTGAQIVSLLLQTADDAGAAGIDRIFGNGILNIARAFQPQGQTMLAGSAIPISLSDNGEASPAMGDAQGQMAGVVVLDGYSRAFAVDLARTLSLARREQPLTQALQPGVRSATGGAGPIALTVTMRRSLTGHPEVGLAQTGLSYEDATKARAIAGLAISRITPDLALAIGFSESGKALQQRLGGQGQTAFLVARDPMARTGFTADGGTAVGVRQRLGACALTVTSERGRVYNAGLRLRAGEPGYSMSTVTADRAFGPATLSLGLAHLSEERTILGGRFSDAFGNGGAASTFLDLAATIRLGDGWSSHAAYRRGWTRMPGTGALVDRGRLATDAFAFDLSKRHMLIAGDSFAIRIMQPLRVRSGGLDLRLPISYDYQTGGVGYEMRQFSLAPKGRELDFEAAYAVRLLGGFLDLNGFYRKDPGHIDALSDDIGGAIRFTSDF